jgi:hypothetical protein
MVFVANPRRLSVFWSKTVVAAGLTFVASVVGLLLSWLVVELVLGGNPVTPMEAGTRPRLLAVIFVGIPVSMALFSVIGLSLAALIRSVPLSMLGVFGVIYLLPAAFSVASMAGSRFSWLNSVEAVLPTEAYKTFSGAGVDSVSASWWMPSWWVALLLLVAWAVAFSIAGSLVMKHTEVK